MSDPTAAARKIFRWAAWYGVVALAPMYFLESLFAQIAPPALDHPEYYYGFIGVALAFQGVFFVIAGDPVRYRPLIVPSIFEKFSFAIAAGILTATGRSPVTIAPFAAIDALLGFAFIWAWITTPAE